MSFVVVFTPGDPPRTGTVHVHHPVDDVLPEEFDGFGEGGELTDPSEALLDLPPERPDSSRR
ncbi:hypothetical protein [Micromonospora sp. NPDC005413]|uniref:hypothetical protein n=1 Tax=Micromonospora sp. NPDC005413 TaxID=3154563 RepID=UPI0033B638E5